MSDKSTSLSNSLSSDKERIIALEKALSESEERFRAFYEKVPLGYQSLDENGFILEVNETWLETLGYNRDEVKGRWFGNFLADDQVEVFRQRFPQFKKQGKIHSEFLMKHKNGRTRYLIFDGRIGHKSDGSFDRTHCILQDITENKASEEKFKYIFESSNAGKSITNIDGRLNVNEAFARMLGYSKEELSAKTWKELTPKEEIPYIEQLLKPLLNGEQDSGRFIKRYIRKNGEVIWCDVSVSVRRDFNGMPLHYITTVIDITEQRRNEEILKESETRFRTLVESAPVGIIISDVNEKTTFANRKFTEIFGYTIKDVASVTEWWQLAYPDPIYRTEMQRRWSEVMNNQKDYNGNCVSAPMECKVRCSDGTTRIVTIDVVTAGDMNIVTFIDITGLKEAEEKILMNKVFMETILDNIPIGVAVNSVFPDVRAVYINDTFARIYRVEKEKLTEPDKFWDMVYENPEFREEIRNTVLEDCKRGDTDKMVWKDIPIERKGEKTTYITARNIPLPDSNLMISTVVDVTERKLAEDELRKLKDKLEIRIAEKTAELEERVEELERFHEATIERELRMSELKEENKRLKSILNEKKR